MKQHQPANDETKKKLKLDMILSEAPDRWHSETSQNRIQQDSDTIKTDELLQIFREQNMHKPNTYHSHGDFFWAKQEVFETPKKLEKLCDSKDIKQDDLYQNLSQKTQNQAP